ncbi:hypothetical protein NCC78_08125 [Micromonospora phytophila]|uniref:hypothetical protein n=1 Tax=Micromonospora phytophila TaxID=709888 RepID=UPI002030F51C|nr:hypothetical protein [Micromonospora phytophila]MCM0674653.1 hypothetical protein [Micromonospora phytophila]
MDDLQQQLRAAVATAPPTRIDVDRLIAADRQRRRHRAWTLAGTGIAAAVAAVTVTPALLAGPGPDPGGLPLPPAGAGSPSAGPSLCAVAEPEPSGPQPPLQTYDTVRARPTEGPAAALARLTGALRPALGALPSGVAVDGILPNCDLVQFTYHPSYREYEAVVRLTRGGQVDRFSVSLRPTAADERTGCVQAPDPGDCTSSRAADGSVVVTSTARLGDAGREQRWVLVQRPDGTSVVAVTNNFLVGDRPDREPAGGFEPPLLTVEQLVEIARTPGLTLYP